MNLDTELSCTLCDNQYQSDNPPRLLTGCGHTYCEKCLKNLITQKKGSYKIVCPEDGQMVSLQDDNLTNLPKNMALVKIMETKKQNNSFKDSSLDMSKINKNDSLQDDEDDARDLVDAIGSTSQTHSKQIEDKSATEMCPNHQKPLDVVCILDLKKICANCAIFGEHKGHDFKSLDEIESQRVDYYTSILNIMDKKQSICDRISNEATCSQIMGILTNKQQKLKKSITSQYKKLIETIQLRQKDSLKHLDLITQKTQIKLKNLMKIQAPIMQKYTQWEDKSYSEIKILEGEDFEAKLELLFVASHDYSADVIEQGDNIIVEMNKQEENLIQQVQLALENIGVDFNNEIFNHVEGFVDIYDEVKKKKIKARGTKNQTSLSKPPVPARKQQVLPKNINQTTKIVVDNTQKSEQKIQTASYEVQAAYDDQDDLLDIEEPEQVTMRPAFIKQEQMIQISPKKIEEKSQKKIEKSQKSFDKSTPYVIKDTKDHHQSSVSSSVKDNSFVHDKIQRPNKKKLSKIKSTEKYEKILDNLGNDNLQILDLTNAQLGDNAISIISEFLHGSKVKTVKLIRNKLNDETIKKIIPYMGSVVTLNLSQNLLTDNVLEIFINGRDHLPAMKNIILSLNKIIERKHKAKIDKLRSLDIIVSV